MVGRNVLLYSPLSYSSDCSTPPMAAIERNVLGGSSRVGCVFSTAPSLTVFSGVYESDLKLPQNRSHAANTCIDNLAMK